MEFTDIIEIHTVELPKLPDSADGSDLYDWAKFIAAETEEELSMAGERNPQVERAVVKLRELSADERARDLFERREKGRMDFESHMGGARAEGSNERAIAIARRLLLRNRPIEEIMEDTGLTRTEVDSLRDLN